MRRLILTVIVGAFIAFGSLALLPAKPAYACVPAANNCSGRCTSHGFLGLHPWYQYLELNQTSNDTSCDVSFRVLPNGNGSSSLPLVLLAIVDDLVRIAGLAAVGYVIWGGVKYITSQGSPDGTKQAQQTVLNALIGLTISIVAAAFVSYIGRKLAGG